MDYADSEHECPNSTDGKDLASKESDGDEPVILRMQSSGKEPNVSEGAPMGGDVVELRKKTRKFKSTKSEFKAVAPDLVVDKGLDHFIVSFDEDDRRAAKVRGYDSADSLKDEIANFLNDMVRENPDRMCQYIPRRIPKQQVNIKMSQDAHSRIVQQCIFLNIKPAEWLCDVIEGVANKYPDPTDAAWKVMASATSDRLETDSWDEMVSPWVPKNLVDHMNNVSLVTDCARFALLNVVIAHKLDELQDLKPEHLQVATW